MKTIIYLIRHSKPLKYKTTFENTEDDKQILNEKIILSPEGEKLAYNLSKQEELNNIDVVISSNYVRCISTAKYIVLNNNCEFIIDSNLGERKLGNEKLPLSFWKEQLLNDDVKTFDGESRKEVRKRMLKVINDVLLKYKGKKVVLLTHATAMTFLLLNWCKLEEVHLENKRRKLSFNGNIIIDDSFNTPEVFKLIFEDENLIDIKRIIINV